MGRRTRIRVGEKEVDVSEEEFEIVREEWNEYRLLDGGTVRVKTVIQRIFRVLGPDGRPTYNANGDPEYVVRQNTQVVGIE